MHARLLTALLSLGALSLTACGVETGDAPGQQTADIVEGTVAHAYPEAVHVNMVDEYGPAGSCSGTLIAPRVVLTAAHCIQGFRAWGVYAPFADGQGTMATKAEVYDWEAGMAVDLDKHDVGVVLLDEDFVIDHYPRVASEPVPHGTDARIVGRTKQGFISIDWLFESSSIPLLDRMPFSDQTPERYYWVPKMVQGGDSGGGVYADDPEWEEGTPRTVTAVVATTHHVTRIDRVHEWISGFLPEE